MRTETLTCIICPMACTITVTLDDNGNIVEIKGYTCPRGKKFAEEEVTEPKRIVTTTIRIKNGLWPMLPVRTAAPVPKKKQFEILDEIHSVVVEAPVKMNQVVLKNVAGTGVDVIAERDMPRV